MRNVLLACGLAGLACDKPVENHPACFDTHRRTSDAARAVFARHDLQGGGPTWEALLDLVVRRRATVSGDRGDAPPPGVTGAISKLTYRGAVSWVAIDAEGDGARFCTGAPGLFAEVSAEFDRLNSDPAALDAAIAQAPDIE